MARKVPMGIVLAALLAIVPLTVAASVAPATAGEGTTATAGAPSTHADEIPGTVGDLGPGLAMADLRADSASTSIERLRNAQPARRTDERTERAAREAPGDEPILLVHGFADTGYTPWWVEMTDDLGDAGYDHGEVFVLNLGAIPGSTVHSPEDYGEAVCDALDTVKAETGADEVDVVAHSMGGLDARHCIEKQGGAEDVDDLVTLGTPHQGTYVAYLAYITPGARDMIPGSDFLTDLNDGQLAESVEYTAVWSDWDELINPDEYAKLPTEERTSVPNAQNVFVDNSFHVQLVWDDDVFDAWIEYLD